MQFDSSKVFTMVNAEQLKLGDKVIPAHCLADLKRKVVNNEDTGTLIRVESEDTDFRFVVERDNKLTQFGIVYLVEPATESEWRPYSGIEELIKDFCERYECPHYMVPTIWVVLKKETGMSIETITTFKKSAQTKDSVVINGTQYYMEDLFRNCTYFDGSIIGAKAL